MRRRLRRSRRPGEGALRGRPGRGARARRPSRRRAGRPGGARGTLPPCVLAPTRPEPWSRRSTTTRPRPGRPSRTSRPRGRPPPRRARRSRDRRGPGSRSPRAGRAPFRDGRARGRCRREAAARGEHDAAVSARQAGPAPIRVKRAPSQRRTPFPSVPIHAVPSGSTAMARASPNGSPSTSSSAPGPRGSRLARPTRTGRLRRASWPRPCRPGRAPGRRPGRARRAGGPGTGAPPSRETWTSPRGVPARKLVPPSGRIAQTAASAAPRGTRRTASPCDDREPFRVTDPEPSPRRRRRREDHSSEVGEAGRESTSGRGRRSSRARPRSRARGSRSGRRPRRRRVAEGRP